MILFGDNSIWFETFKIQTKFNKILHFSKYLSFASERTAPDGVNCVNVYVKKVLGTPPEEHKMAEKARPVQSLPFGLGAAPVLPEMDASNLLLCC